MKTNVGSYDGAVRFLVGCIILFFSVNGLGWWAILGVVPILSAACGFCPLYWLFRINTAAWEADYERRNPPSHVITFHPRQGHRSARTRNRVRG